MTERPATPFDDILLLVGWLNYSWTNTESLLIHLIAGLLSTDKDRAVIVFLTLNTTRARIDLVERLAKLEQVPEEEKHATLELTGRVMKHSGLRNRFSHSIYAFDPNTNVASTIMMRIADRKDNIKVGRSDTIDAQTIKQIEEALDDMAQLNRDFWAHIRRFDYPT